MDGTRSKAKVIGDIGAILVLLDYTKTCDNEVSFKATGQYSHVIEINFSRAFDKISFGELLL